jgi:hypothetical protein
MLLFKKKFLDLIRSGEKTQTIRIWPHRKYRAGQRSYIPGVGYIAIETVDAVALGELTDRDAQLDGFVTVEQLRQEIARLYPDGLTGGHQAFRVRFRVFSAEEQAIAAAEREKRKIATSKAIPSPSRQSHSNRSVPPPASPAGRKTRRGRA